MSFLIVFEGTDASGKQTQSEKLFYRLEKEGKNCKKISFPNYDSEASAPVKMYLEGRFGNEPEKINPYPISTMYAIDRYASYKEDWGVDYRKNKLIIADRYTTSNIIHQASKLRTAEEKDSYIQWLEDLEYNKMELPRPNLVIFLNMPSEKAKELMENRKNKINGEEKKDIHEEADEYLKKSYENACYIAEKLSWCEISCVDNNGELKSIETIHQEIYEKVSEYI